MGSYRPRSIAAEFEGRSYRMGLKVSVHVHETSLDNGLLDRDVLGELVVVLDAGSGHLWLHLRASADDADGQETEAEA